MPILFTVLLVLFYLVVFGIVFYMIFLIHKWVINSISYKKEQNEMLRELIEILRTK